MNRENRRALQKKLKGKKSRTLASEVLGASGDKSRDVIHDGDLVTLNVDRIMGRKDYPRMQESYRKFVEANRWKVFVAHPRHKRPDGFSATVELDGVENWIFWYGDLLRVESIQTEEGNRS